MTSGLHHITAITRRIQANVDFYTGFLGLRLVKRTAGFEDVNQLHLFYGDGAATPGSLVTFLAWEDGAPGRVGHGAPSEIGFAVAPEAMGFWLTRALQFHIRFDGPRQEFAEPVLRLTDPDGIIVKLVGAEYAGPWTWWQSGGVPEAEAIRGLRGATILSERPDETAAFLMRHMGWQAGPVADSIRRLDADSGAILDIRDASGFWTAAPGTGTIDHIALRAPDRAAIEAVEAELRGEGESEVTVHDRKYFHSLYVREPGGNLIELASDGPGFALDEAPEALGTALFIPPHFTGNPEDLKVVLPQFALPGEERIIRRDLDFVHRIYRPEVQDDSVLVLLHGTGANETSLLAMAHRIAPQALLIGVRGRATDEGVPRFFRRFSQMQFDQKDIRAEAEAFAAFVGDLAAAYGVDPERAVFLGYSNGANMLGALMQLHPGAIRRAVLLRSINVLEEAVPADLSGTDVLSVSATDDFYGSYAQVLEARLGTAGARVTAIRLKGNHGIGAEDEAVVRDWLAPAEG